MSGFRLSAFLAVSGAVAAGALLFWTSQNVQQAEVRLAAVEKAVRGERQSIRVLNAEWAYLNRPDRLEDLAIEYLGLSTPAAAFSVGDGISGLPRVVMPAVPPRKPLLAAQPAVLRAPEEPAESSPPAAMESTMSFQLLLKSLNETGGGE